MERGGTGVAGSIVDEHVDASLLALTVLCVVSALGVVVVVGWFGVFEDYVPGVDEAGDVAEHEEEDVDY